MIDYKYFNRYINWNKQNSFVICVHHSYIDNYPLYFINPRFDNTVDSLGSWSINKTLYE